MTLARTRPIRGYRTAIDPFDTFDRVIQQMTGGSFADGSDGATSYPYDLYETDEALMLQMAVPGVSADALDVSIEGRQLTVRATVPEAETAGRYWTQSIPRGEIGRTVKLPASIDADAVHATVRDGLLTLHLPKVQEAKVRKIDVVRS
ncbi:MAG: Hsp20/alpha crystallin family protein [Trueperaceae bacterium]